MDTSKIVLRPSPFPNSVVWMASSKCLGMYHAHQIFSTHPKVSAIGLLLCNEQLNGIYKCSSTKTGIFCSIASNFYTFFQYITLTLTDPCACKITRQSMSISLSFAALPETRVFLLLFVTVMKWTQMAGPSHPYTTGGGASCTSTILVYFQASCMCCDRQKRPHRQSVLHGLSNISYNHHQECPNTIAFLHRRSVQSV
jgi:hypothetical protein